MTSDTINYPPDYDLANLTPGIFNQAVRRYGAIVVRNIVPQDVLATFLERAKLAYARRDDEYNRNQMSTKFFDNMYKLGNLPANDLDIPGEQFSIISRVILNTPLIRLFTSLYGPNIGFFLNSCVARRQRPNNLTNTSLPYHQDATFIGDRFITLNAWTPLVECGVSAPGLEVVLDGNITTIIKPQHINDESKSPYERISLTPEWIEANYSPEQCWHPLMKPGDVLIFTNFTIHRTFQKPEMNEERISLELRCGAIN